MALTEAVKKGIWLKGLVSDLRQETAVVLKVLYVCQRIKSFMTR